MMIWHGPAQRESKVRLGLWQVEFLNGEGSASNVPWQVETGPP